MSGRRAGAPAPHAGANGDGSGRRLSAAWLLICLPLAAAALLSARLLGLAPLTAGYLRQDLLVVPLIWAVLATAGALGSRLLSLDRGRPWLWSRIVLLAGLAGLVAYAGSWLVFERHLMTGDERMAEFDARVFGTGRRFAVLPSEWRAYLPALQPMFRLSGPNADWWMSGYLPINAFFRAGFGRLGDPALAGPFWAALSVGLTYAVGRRLRPAEPAVGVAAAVLLATSSQFLLAAMTPYAMPAHLALNMLWLLLFLRGGALGHAGAIATGFLATGLHQLIFHPLFAAPFCLQLLIARRWTAAAAYALGYVGIGLFWASYWSWAFPTPPAVENLSSATGWVRRAAELVGGFDAAAFGYMAANLLRFVTWQNPLVAPLLALGVLGAWRADGHFRALWGGMALTAAAMLVLLPYQGHGWGYRYLHGLLGSACLLAAMTWSDLLRRGGDAARGRALRQFAVTAGAAMLVLLPVRAWQANRYIHPFAEAARAIARADAEVVVVDAARLRFGADLVRNDPFLRNRPLVMDGRRLTAADLARLCARGRVVLFTAEAGRSFGMEVLPPADGSAGSGLAWPACTSPMAVSAS